MQRTRNFFFLALAIVVAAIAIWVSFTPRTPDTAKDHVPSEDQSSADEQKSTARNSVIGDDSAFKPAEKSEFPLPDRSVLPTNSEDRILRDVEDSQIDHAALEPFLVKRPMSAYRIVEVNVNELQARVRQAAENPTLELILFDEEPVRLLARSADEHHSGWRTGQSSWIGKVVGEEVSTVQILATPDSTINATVMSAKLGHIAIEPIPSTPFHIVWSMDPNVSMKID